MPTQLPRYSDVLDCNRPDPKPEAKPVTRRMRLWRHLQAWLGITALYAAFAVCPCCGRQGCPIGLATAGGVGAVLAFGIHWWRRALHGLKHLLDASTRPKR